MAVHFSGAYSKYLVADVVLEGCPVSVNRGQPTIGVVASALKFTIICCKGGHSRILACKDRTEFGTHSFLSHIFSRRWMVSILA